MPTLIGIRGLLAALASTGCLLALAASPVGASTTLMTCTGQSEVNFNPGLTYTEQIVAVNGQENAGSCISLTHPNLHSFAGPFSGSTQLSCLALLATASGTQTLYWNGSKTSTSFWEWTSTPTQTGSLIVVVTTGQITAGVLDGATVTQENVYTADRLDACNQPGGLTHVEGPSTWQFTGL